MENALSLVCRTFVLRLFSRTFVLRLFGRKQTATKRQPNGDQTDRVHHLMYKQKPYNGKIMPWKSSGDASPLGYPE